MAYADDCEHWLHVLLGAVGAGVHAVDQRGITVLYNEQAGTLDGLSMADVQGKHVLEVFPSLSEETSSLLRVLKTGETISHRRQTYRNFRGEEVHTTNTTRPVFANGALVGAIEVASDITEMKNLAERVVELEAARFGARRTRNRASGNDAVWSLDQFLTRDPRMEDLKEVAKRIARTSSPILVYGETGTGKELLVHGIHLAGPRAHSPFVAQNCAALPASLLEGILFGTAKGSFTGAENRPGLFELAHGGTLFLDELNSMPPELQAKLLRALEEGRVRRLGDTKVMPIDVRVVAAMNADPEEAVKSGALRADLYYRIRVVTLIVPPLRERKEDIALLVMHFVQEFNRAFHMEVQGLTPEAWAIIELAPWPGNVRELRHAIEAAMNVVEDHWIDVVHLPAYLGATSDREAGVRFYGHAGSMTAALPDRVRAYEQRCIVDALRSSGGNLAGAARTLGIPRQTLQSKLAKLPELTWKNEGD